MSQTPTFGKSRGETSMVTAIRDQKYTLEEYFELERNSEERYEFWNGHVWTMAGASATKIDQPRQDIFSCRVDIEIALLRPSCTPFGDGDRIDRDDLFDHVIFGDDVERPGGGLSAAVDDHRVAYDDAFEAFAGERPRICLGETN